MTEPQREVARDSVTEGARVTLSLYKHYRNALSLSLLLRKIQLPPGGSLCHAEHSVITFYLFFSAHRHSLHRTPPLWRGFRDTKTVPQGYGMERDYAVRRLRAVVYSVRQIGIGQFLL